MRVRVTYRLEYMSIDITDLDTVRDVKEIVRQHFYIGPDGGAGSLEGNEKKILTLKCAGSILEDHWYFMDVGIRPGTTVKAVLIAEVKPVLYIYCAFNERTEAIVDRVPVPRVTVAEVRALTTRKTGIPVGVFRLTYNKKELYDCQYLDDYGIDVGDTLRMETWDGWNEFLCKAISGYASPTFKKLSSDEVVARYQMKVAMYIAAHFGRVDLAVSLMRQGIRADEPVGDHPARLWCRGEDVHIDSLKAPVHESAEAGELGVLRAFVNQNVCNVLARDGNGLTPLNIALRKKQKPCASFLLTKQWSKINYADKGAIPLSIYVKIKRWGDRSKDKVLIMHGQWKSSIKNPRRHGQPGALLSNGIQLDGFTTSKMNSKNSKMAKFDEEREKRRKRRLFSGKDKRNDIDYDEYFKAKGTVLSFKLPRLSRLSKSMSRHNNVQRLQMLEDTKSESHSSDGSEAPSQGTEGYKKTFRPRSSSNSAVDRVRLPPIKEQKKSSSHQNLTGGKSDTDGSKTKSSYIQTGMKGVSTMGKLNRSISATSSLSEKTNTESRDQSDQQLQRQQSKKPAEPKKSGKPKQSKKGPTKKKGRKITSADVLGKNMITDSNIPLPTSSIENNPKPFFFDFSGDIPGKTLQLYERYRGYGPREYAFRCLSIANTFKDKPWLQQVRQAVLIARNGVDKTITNKPTIFSVEQEQAAQRRTEQKKLSANSRADRRAGENAGDRPISAAEETVISMNSGLNDGRAEDLSNPIEAM